MCFPVCLIFGAWGALTFVNERTTNLLELPAGDSLYQALASHCLGYSFRCGVLAIKAHQEAFGRHASKWDSPTALALGSPQRRATHLPEGIRAVNTQTCNGMLNVILPMMLMSVDIRGRGANFS